MFINKIIFVIKSELKRGEKEYKSDDTWNKFSFILVFQRNSLIRIKETTHIHQEDILLTPHRKNCAANNKRYS